MDNKTITYRFDDWFIEPSLNHVRRDEEVKQLEPLAMKVLTCLLESAGEVVTTESYWIDSGETDMQRQVWLRDVSSRYGARWETMREALATSRPSGSVGIVR